MTGMQWVWVWLAAMGGFTLGMIWARYREARRSEVVEIGPVGPDDMLMLSTTGTLSARDVEIIKTAWEEASKNFSETTDKPMALVMPKGILVQIVRNYRDYYRKTCIGLGAESHKACP